VQGQPAIEEGTRASAHRVEVRQLKRKPCDLSAPVRALDFVDDRLRAFPGPTGEEHLHSLAGKLARGHPPDAGIGAGNERYAARITHSSHERGRLGDEQVRFKTAPPEVAS